MAEMTQAARWRYALKPASWPKLLLPTLLGQVLGATAVGSLSLAAAGLGLLFTLLNGSFIVLMNDWGDQEVDALKRRMFPDGCSPKTIPDGILPPRQLLLAGSLAGLGSVLLAFVMGALLELPWLGFMGLLCALTFVAYSLPPLALNYRGGGEALEALGVGLLLPWFHAHAQSGLGWAPTWWLLPGFVLLSLASALASGLADEDSDRLGGKRTLVTLAGNGAARRMTEALLLLGLLVWLLTAWWVPALTLWAIVPAVLVAGGWFIAMLRVSPLAVTAAFPEQGEYKRRLHRAIWLGGLFLVLGLILVAWTSSP